MSDFLADLETELDTAAHRRARPRAVRFAAPALAAAAAAVVVAVVLAAGSAPDDDRSVVPPAHDRCAALKDRFRVLREGLELPGGARRARVVDGTSYNLAAHGCGRVCIDGAAMAPGGPCLAPQSRELVSTVSGRDGRFLHYGIAVDGVEAVELGGRRARVVGNVFVIELPVRRVEPRLVHGEGAPPQAGGSCIRERGHSSSSVTSLKELLAIASVSDVDPETIAVHAEDRIDVLTFRDCEQRRCVAGYAPAQPGSIRAVCANPSRRAVVPEFVTVGRERYVIGVAGTDVEEVVAEADGRQWYRPVEEGVFWGRLSPAPRGDVTVRAK